MLNFTSPKFTLDAISNPALIKDIHGIYTHCNQAYLDIVNKSSDEVLGRTVHQILPDAVAQIHAQIDQQLLVSPSGCIQYEVECPEFTPCPLGAITVNKSVIRSENGTIIGFIAILSIHKHQYSTNAKTIFKLTKQESCILSALNCGLSVKSIASSLQISTHTVSGHMKAIYVKMNVNSRAEAQSKTRAITILGG